MSNHSQSRRRKHVRHAALFIDYTNLTDVLADVTDQTIPPDEQVVHLLADVVKLLRRKYRVQLALLRAHGDFGGPDEEASVLQSLYAAGIDARYVPAYTAADATLSLGIDALSVLDGASEVTTFVLVTGDQALLPLVRHLRARGRQVIVATAATPDLPESDLQRSEAQFVDLSSMLEEQARRYTASRTIAQPRRAVAYSPLDDPNCLNTLEVIEEHFGHYDEVYLTPLLRKLSEVFDDTAYDPKTVISDLEQAGAVRLEKRHGTPYDYTVLIVERDHPDVRIIRRQFADRDESEAPYDEDDPTSDAGGAAAYDDADDRDAPDETDTVEVDMDAPSLTPTGDGQPLSTIDDADAADGAPEEDRV